MESSSLFLRRLQATAAPTVQSLPMPYYVDIGAILIVGLLLMILTSIFVAYSESKQKLNRAKAHERFVARHGVDEAAFRKSSNFYQENGYSWDLVIVLKQQHTEADRNYLAKFLIDQHDSASDSMKSKLADETSSANLDSPNFVRDTILRRLRMAGIEYYLVNSAQKDEVFVKIRAPIVRLLREADRVDFYLPLNEKEAEDRLATGTAFRKGISYHDKMLNTTLGAFQYIHANYDMDKKLRTLFVNPKLTARLQRDGLAHLCTANIAPDSQAQGDVLSNTQRLVLLHSIIGARVFRGGAHLELGTFKKRGVILGYFCLHHSVSLDELEESWLFARPWDTPVDQIREYFGERIGLYFGFQSFVTTWVVFAAAVGVLAWIALAFNGNNPSAGDMPYYGGIMAVWATLMLEFWKQREARYAMQWGTSHFEKNEAERPGFDGVIVESPVNMEHEVHFPDGQKYSRVILSNVIVGCLLLLDLGVMAAIMYLRIYLNSLPSLQISGVQLGNFIASFINSFQIVVGNYLFQMVAKNLTEYENYRTDTEYEDALVYKSFSFIFINSYASLFYIAFAKSNIGSFDQCVNFDCMEELKSTLGMLFITNIVVVTLTRLGVPLAQQYVSKRSNFVGADGQPLVEDAIPEVERDFTLGDFDDLLGTFDKYSVDAVTYGYLTMFITAYPLASLMVLIQNFINIRVDAFCMCNLFRRPVARQAQDTGSWQKVYEFLGFAAVVVNSALVAFTGTYCIEYKPETRVWVFIGMCVLLMTAKYAAMSFVDDVPKEVVIQLKRQDFIISKVINEIPDDNSWKDKGAKKPVNEDPAHLVVDDFDKNPY